MKRLLDLVLAISGLCLLCPLLLFLALLVRVKLGSPILFKQQRPGLHGKPFYIYKFRSMNEIKDAEGVLLSDVERLPPFGCFLRRSSLDELPQLYNVLKGDISLVGPRALLMEYLPLYSTEQARRHEVKPGITGWAQVNGRNAVSWQARFKLDAWYIEHQSFWLDIKILWMTLGKVIRRDGVSEVGQVTMSKFTGNVEGKTNSL